MRSIFRLSTFIVGFLFLSFTFSPTIAPPQVLNETAILKAAEKLPHKGILKQGNDGYLFLKVTDDYVYKLFPMLQLNGFRKPSSFRWGSKTRAHISVMYKDDGQRLSPIKELGYNYAFYPKRVVRVRKSKKEYIILEVDSPQLGNLRKKYGLPSKLQNHEFHITIAERIIR
jgi:hypothetical protein